MSGPRMDGPREAGDQVAKLSGQRQQSPAASKATQDTAKKTDAAFAERTSNTAPRVVSVDAARLDKAILALANQAKMSEDQAASAIKGALEQVGILLDAKGRTEDTPAWQNALLGELSSNSAYHAESSSLKEHSYSVLIDPSQKEVLGTGAFKEMARAQQLIWQRKEGEISVNASWSVAGRFKGTNQLSLRLKKRELEAVRQLAKLPEHPNVVRYRIFTHGGDERPVCEEGRFDFATALQQGLLTEEAILDILIDVLEGAQHLLTNDAIHGDHKVGNIVLFDKPDVQSSGYTAKLIDPGSMVFLDSGSGQTARRSLQEQIYSAPEAARAATASDEVLLAIEQRLSALVEKAAPQELEQPAAQNTEPVLGTYKEAWEDDDDEGSVDPYAEGKAYMAELQRGEQPESDLTDTQSLDNSDVSLEDESPSVAEGEQTGYNEGLNYVLRRSSQLSQEQFRQGYRELIDEPSEETAAQDLTQQEIQQGYRSLGLDESGDQEEELGELQRLQNIAKVLTENSSALNLGFVSFTDLSNAKDVADILSGLGRLTEAKTIRSMAGVLKSTDRSVQQKGMADLGAGEDAELALVQHLNALAKSLTALVSQHLSEDGLQALHREATETADSMDKTAHERAEVYSLGVLVGMVSGIGIPQRAHWYAQRRLGQQAEVKVARAAAELPVQVDEAWSATQKSLYQIVQKMVHTDPARRGTLSEALEKLKTVKAETASTN